ncbi:uncharacterized protein LOC134935903 [Pseudophryne corroboree]|uniref:uncharacterized protein LOC134935903 n=1 Tax=Pseudophryne corroboree TaxID=495146 RepID=UPI003081F0EC
MHHWVIGWFLNIRGMSKCSRPCVTTFLVLFLFLNGSHCKSGLGSTWNDRIKDAMISITGKIPPVEGIPVGQIISMLLKVFWPSSEPDIWSLIKDQVEGLVDQKILEFELQERNNEIRALQKTMQMYVEAQIREKGSLMSTMVHASNELFFKLTDSKNSVQLIPLLVTHSTQHLTILKERLLHGKEMYCQDNSQVWKSDLEYQISTYKDSINTIYLKWVEWRKAKITLDIGLHTPPTTIPPFFRFEPYGNVYDELTKESANYLHSGLNGPNDKNYFRKICEAVKKNMFSVQNGEILQILVTSFYLDNFIPGNEDNPSVIPASMSKASFGPISPSVQVLRNDKFRLFTPGDDNTRNGEVTGFNVREWNILDGFQVLYSTHSGAFIGNRGGGALHEVRLNNKRAKSLKFCANNCDMIEVTIGFSNGESTGRLGNRGGWRVECVNTGGIDLYGLYNARLSGGGCDPALYQIELDYKAYPARPSQFDTGHRYHVDLASENFKYRSILEETN